MTKRILMQAVLAGLVAGYSIGAEEEIDFNRDIRPIISNKCVACHGPDEAERKADLRLDTFAGATKDLGGYSAIVPGDTEASELIYRIVTEDDTDVMPPGEKGPRLTEEQIELLKRWIEQGGKYDLHWSYQKPERPALPKVKDAGWPKNAIDHFVLSRLEKEGLQPSPEADRWMLARRLSLDLTGLPPSWDEAKAFVDDKRPDAVERFVDLQLAKPAFGERWARVWLDLARYADSAGYADDPPRTIWAYRDYVVRSLNQNKPFDQFTIEQIAGDLLENPTEDQLVATAFHRNTLTNNEGGTTDEEFRNVAVVDRVNTTMAVWMGTTMACAQCHTHKYDPFTQEEYFRFFAFFNQSQDADLKDESPLLELWSEEQEKQEKELQEEISSLKDLLSTLTPELAAEKEKWLAGWRQNIEWSVLRPSSATAKNGLVLINKEGALSAESTAANNSYDLQFPLSETSGKAINGLKLRVSPEQKQNFVLSQVSARWVPDKEEKAPMGRYVRVEIPGTKKILHLAEVEVFSGGKNVAPFGTAKQSSTGSGGLPERAIDGNSNGDYAKASVAHTGTEDNPWFEVDLGKTLPVDQIKVWNRTDGGSGIQDRIKGYRVVLLDEKREVVFEKKPGGIPSPSESVALTGAESVMLRAVSASFEQNGFAAKNVLSGKPDPAKGWAIAGGTGKAQELLLALGSPLDKANGILELTLHQDSEHRNHLLREFRIEATGDSRVRQWVSLPEGVKQAVQNPAANRNEAQEKAINDYFLGVAPSLGESRKKLADAEKKLAAMKPETTVPVMRELAEDKHRETFIQIRGNYQNLDEKVSQGVPAVFPPLEEGRKRDRLALAKWLVSDDNPLTARVVANRHWEQIFGIGIVETSEEFGSQGKSPSHPELLDWLAVELMESGWDLKHFLRTIVLSSTYRQSSRVGEEQLEADPFNRFLARGPRFRISAEMVRDQALKVSGLLSEKMYGPPVNPPQPELGLKAAFGKSTDWVTSKGEDRYRRGIYTMWRRSSPYPSMAAFDAPNREVCTVRRGRTNTPLQALVTLNDPVYVEAAQAIGRRMEQTVGGDADKARFGLEQTLLRPAKDEEVKRLVQLYRETKEEYGVDLEQARLMAEDPIGPVPEGGDVTSLAAWTVVGNVLLNLDEVFLKR